MEKESRFVRAQAIVLRKTKLGEADLIATLLAEDGSQLRAVGKGARKPASRLAPKLDPGCLLSVLVSQGRSLGTISEAALMNPYPTLRFDPEGNACMSLVCEAACDVTHPEIELPRMFACVLAYLDAAEEAAEGPHAQLALALACVMKAHALAGCMPSLRTCVVCGEALDPLLPARVCFDADSGGYVCPSCRAQGEGGDAPLVDAGLLVAAARLLHSPYAEVVAAPPELADAKRLLRLVVEWHEVHFGRRLKSARLVGELL